MTRVRSSFFCGVALFGDFARVFFADGFRAEEEAHPRAGRLAFCFFVADAVLRGIRVGIAVGAKTLAP